MNKYFLLLFSIYATVAFSQIKVDYNHDLKGNPIEGEFHTFLQSDSPSVQIKIDGKTSVYEKGFYVDLQKKKHEGYIELYKKKISFKYDNSNYSETSKSVSASEIQYIKLGVDSIFIAKKVHVDKEILKKPILVKYIARYGKNHFGKVYQNNGLNYIVVKTPNVDFWRKIKNKSKKEFKGVVAGNFKDVPFLQEKIEDNSLTRNNLIKVIKRAQFYEKYKNKDTLYFNENWHELLSSIDSKYVAQVVELKDTIWSVDYYKDNKKLYEVDYSSISPMVKSGFFKIFDAKNVLSEERKYSNDSILEIKKYYPNGSLKYKWVLNEDTGEKKYVVVNNKQDNKGVINEYGEGIQVENYNDSIEHHFLNFKKIKSFNVVNKEVFYSDKYSDINLNKFQNLLSKFLYSNSEYKLLRKKKNLEGTVLISLVIDRKGNLISYNLLNELDSDLSNLLKLFFESKMINNKQFKFKGFNIGSDDNEFKKIKFLIPIVFSYNRSDPVYNSYNDFWFHHMMFQQIQMHQQMTAPAIRF